jgi:hypothetical protein
VLVWATANIFVVSTNAATSQTTSGEIARSKNILLLQSFGPAFPPFATWNGEITRELYRQSPFAQRRRDVASVVRRLAKTRAAGSAKADRRVSDLDPGIQSIRRQGATSASGIAAPLKERGITAPQGGARAAAQVRRVLARTTFAQVYEARLAAGGTESAAHSARQSQMPNKPAFTPPPSRAVGRSDLQFINHSHCDRDRTVRGGLFTLYEFSVATAETGCYDRCGATFS